MKRLFASVSLMALSSTLYSTEVRLSVGAGAMENMPVLALPVFEATDAKKGTDALLAKDLREIVRSDLMLSRRFDVKDEVPGAPNIVGAVWRLKAYAGESVGKLSAQVRLENGGGTAESIFERFYRQEKQWLRALAHRIADDVVKAATGREGIARTRIAFINDQTGHKEVYVMDFDGENAKQLTNDKSLSLLPRFSPDARKLAYTSYKDGNPDLFLINLETGHASTLSDVQGLNIAGGFSLDGTKLLMTLSNGKSPNLYMKDLASGANERLTSHFGADSTPTFSPDARQVAFVSDRSGNPQLYALDLTTKKARRLTNMNWCDAPAWSPSGEWIAFAGRANRRDKMDIFLVDVTGTHVRQLTHGEGSNEDPSWSPDGRLLAFSSTRSGRAQIYVMDGDGSAPRLTVDIPGASTTPHWSGINP